MFNNYTFRGQHMRRWVPFTTIGLLGLLVILTIVIIVRHKPVPREYYVEKPMQQANGTVINLQPDHGWMYYWLMAQANRPVQPTYHVYTPPLPRAYTPHTPTTYQPSVSPRDSGGFSRPSPSTSPTKTSSPSSSPRNSGGFSSPSNSSRTKSTPSASPRNSGGFSSTPKPTSPRNSGGFSKPKGGSL